jgi:hypothetical protein
MVLKLNIPDRLPFLCSWLGEIEFGSSDDYVLDGFGGLEAMR